MAKMQDLQNSFSGGSRKKKKELTPEEIDRIAAEVEPPKDEKPATKESRDELVKTSFDIPVDLYEEMKITLFKRRQSMRDYILGLIKSDLHGGK